MNKIIKVIKYKRFSIEQDNENDGYLIYDSTGNFIGHELSIKDSKELVNWYLEENKDTISTN